MAVSHRCTVLYALMHLYKGPSQIDEGLQLGPQPISAK